MSALERLCLASGMDCGTCEFDSSACPIRADPDLHSYVRFMYDETLEKRREAELHLERCVGILRSHKGPLHYQMLYRIYRQRFRDHPITERAIYHLLSADSSVETLEPGVYRLRTMA